MSAYEKLAGLIVERGAAPIAGRLETAGWWLAPVQLTPEMRTAGQDAGGFDGYRQEDNTDDIWAALRTTAPALPVDAGEGLEDDEKALCLRSARMFLGWPTHFWNRPTGNEAEQNVAAAELANFLVRHRDMARAAAPQPPGVSLAPNALSALKAAKRLCDNINEFGHVTDQVFHDQAERLILATIAQAETGKAGMLEDRIARDMATSPEPSRHGVEAMREVLEEAARLVEAPVMNVECERFVCNRDTMRNRSGHDLFVSTANMSAVLHERAAAVRALAQHQGAGQTSGGA